MSLSKNAELEELRSKLDAYELPEKFQKQSSGGTIDTALLQKYKEARNDYLQRKMMHAVIQKACSTFDGKGFAVPQVPTDEEQEALRQRSDQVLQSVQEKSANFQRQLLELQAKHSLFLTRREEFEQMCLLQNDDDDDHCDDDDDDDARIDEDELAEQEDKLNALQKRRAALEVELKTVQQQNAQADKAVQAHKAQLESLQKESSYRFDQTALLNDPEALEDLKKENIELQSKLEKFQEIESFYKNLRLLTEELHGIRIISVDKAPNNNNADGDNNDMLLKVQLLSKYDVEVVLKTAKRDNLAIVSAKFVSNNIVITGPTSAGKEGGGGGLPPVQLKIPSLDDYVALAASMQLSRPGDNLRFLLRETIARISAVEARVEELTVLQNEVLTKIGKFDNDNSNSYGGQDQEVVCSLNDEQMTVVMRLTPDCPMVDGSVYIDRLVGLGGWDADLVEQIKTTINENRCKSPVTVLRNLKAEILRLQEEEGLSLPETPKMPVRAHEWQ